MLHITNGDSAAGCIAESGIGGDVLPWRDVLHEGPVPQGLGLDELSQVRARFIAGSGWGLEADVLASFRERDAELAGFRAHDEVVLWFEHDLYDQLQLIQLLEWFSSRHLEPTRLTLICNEEYLGTITTSRAREVFHERVAVTDDQMYLARSAWAAFRSPNPTSVERLVEAGTPALPFLQGALRRHLEQFPAADNGLSRSERQALEAIGAGRDTIGDAFVASSHEVEERIFLGDAIFFDYLANLSQGPSPLVLCANGSPIEAPQDEGDYRSFVEQRIVLTDEGRSVLAGALDWLALRPIDRWLGGVHLVGSSPEWRWHAGLNRLIGGAPEPRQAQ